MYIYVSVCVCKKIYVSIHLTACVPFRKVTKRTLL